MADRVPGVGVRSPRWAGDDRRQWGPRAVKGQGAMRGHRESPAAFVLEFEDRVVVGREVVIIADAERGDRRFGEHAIEELDLLGREGLGHLVEEDVPGPVQEKPRDGDQVLLTLGEGAGPVVLDVQPADAVHGRFEPDAAQCLEQRRVVEGLPGCGDQQPLAERAADRQRPVRDELDLIPMGPDDPAFSILPDSGRRREERVLGAGVRAR